MSYHNFFFQINIGLLLFSLLFDYAASGLQLPIALSEKSSAALITRHAVGLQATLQAVGGWGAIFAFPFYSHDIYAIQNFTSSRMKIQGR